MSAVEDSVSAEETKSAYSGPAYAVNRYLVFPRSDNAVRLTFMESHVVGLSQYRTAVVIPRADIPILVELLQRYITSTDETRAQENV